jgi:putative membrane protein insertion efficiency factor
MRRLVCFAIAVYKRVLSPLLPTACRFTPTCSEYASEAVRTHGVLRGLRLATGRLLRCRPFSLPGHDPVPPRAEPPTA